MKNTPLRKPFTYAQWNVTFYIIIMNIGVYAVTRMFPRLMTYLALNPANIVYGHMFWQFFTYFFVHDLYSLQHIFFNMFALLLFGLVTERAIGSKEFLLLYLLSGVACGIASFIIYWMGGAWRTFLYGASGAVYAIMFVYAVVFPRAKIFIWGLLPIPAPLLIAIYAGMEIASQLLNMRSGVAHMTHLAGFAFAWLYLVVRMGVHPWKVWKNAYR